jgi:hypothetical protein
LPLFLLHRLPCLTTRTPPCPHVGTASSAVSWPPRPPHLCSRSTTPIGATSARRSAEPVQKPSSLAYCYGCGAPLQKMEEAAPA